MVWIRMKMREGSGLENDKSVLSSVRKRDGNNAEREKCHEQEVSLSSVTPFYSGAYFNFVGIFYSGVASLLLFFIFAISSR